MLFCPEKSSSFKLLIRKTFIDMIVPYFIFVIIANILQYDVMLERWRVHTAFMLQNTFWHGYGAASLWFFTCLGSVKVCAWLLHRHGFVRTNMNKALLVVGCIILGHVIGVYVPRSIIARSPMMLASVPVALIFFFLGYGCKNWIRAGVEMARRRQLLCFLFLTAVAGGTYSLCCFEEIRLCHYTLAGAVFSCGGLVPCMGGLVAAFLLSVMIMHIPIFNACFSYIGRYSMCFFALEFGIASMISRYLIIGDWFSNPVVNRVIPVLIVSAAVAPLLTRFLFYAKHLVSLIWRSEYV